MTTITWTSDETFQLEGVDYVCDLYGLRRESPSFCIAKHPRVVDRYATLIADLRPEQIVEIGILEGASTALFHALAQPRKLVAIEYDQAPAKLLTHIDRHDLGDTLVVYGGIDQADTDRVTAIIDKEIDGDIDLIVDDASHLLAPSRATFNCLFPRLRPGGIYLLEDWATGLRLGGPSLHGPDERPLVDLVTEIIWAKARHPALILDVTVRSGWVTIERGTDPTVGAFDVAHY